LLKTGEVILFVYGMGLQTGGKVFGIIFVTTGHPTGGFHAMRSHIMIGVLFVMAPRVVAENSIHLQEPKQENQT
jgi:hypothetical protein